VAAARLVWPEREPAANPASSGALAGSTAEGQPSQPPAATNGFWARPRLEVDVVQHQREPRVEVSAPTVDSTLDRDAAPNVGGTCDHCASRDLQLQRMARNDAVLESWWLCGSCGSLSHRIQPADPTNREPGPQVAGVPAETQAAPLAGSGAYSDFGSALKRVLAEETVIASEAARLRAELARAEQDLHDLQLLPQLLGRIIRERQIG
jgi:hypothetical protein